MNDDAPPRIKPRLKSAPKVREFFWCDFPKDAQLPEMWKLRPVIILSFRNMLHGAVMVVPYTTKEQREPGAGFSLQTTIDGREAWAICDKITTVAVSRLTPDKTGIRRMPEDEFHALLEKVLSFLPKLPGTAEVPPMRP